MRPFTLPSRSAPCGARLMLPVLLALLGAARGAAQAPAPPHALHILLTSDEHGWLLPLVDKKAKTEHGGVVHFAERILGEENYAPTPAAAAAGYLLLSAGDMWTGPYESTVLEGAPMTAAMSELGYAAAAVGNHEFDFGTRTLLERSKTSAFPFLAANLIENATGTTPAWAAPFVIVERSGVKVGIVGLTNIDSPVTADPRHLTGLTFQPYAASLERALVQAHAAGAQELMVLLHDDVPRALELLPILRKHGVHVVGAGHHHHARALIDDNKTPDVADDIVICNPGAYLRTYCRIDVAVADGRLLERAAAIKTVDTPIAAPAAPAPANASKAPAALVQTVADAEASANQIGGEVLVQSAQLLARGSGNALGQLVVDTWLHALPYVQVAVTNAGGLRQDLQGGPVRTRDIVSVLPFNNYLLVVDLTGAQLKEVLANPESIFAGAEVVVAGEGATATLISARVDGKPIDDAQTYKVVINDFMYRGGDRYVFQSYDPEPEETALDWREPVLRALRDMGAARKQLVRTADQRKRVVAAK